MLSQIAIVLILVISFVIANIFLKFMSDNADIKALKDELYKKDTLINIYDQYIDIETKNKVVDIYRIKTDPDRWINLYPGFIKLILEEDILVDSKYDEIIVDYIKYHEEETEKLPGTKRYINK